LLSGCICGGYTGAGDRVYQQGTAQLILCANHGFFAQLADGSTIEGTYTESAGTPTTSGVATAGSTGTLAFDYTITSDTLAAPQLGDNAWTAMSLDKTARDHADVHCTDLEMRPWWPTTAAQ
jgi:hypothetical protein